MHAEESCETCKFWNPDVEGTGELGDCLRMPPLVAKERRTLKVFGDNIWPITWINEWCGEFQQKKIELPVIPVQNFPAWILFYRSLPKRLQVVLERDAAFHGKTKIDSFEKLVDLTESDILGLPGIGNTTLCILQDRLFSIGLELKKE